MYEEQVFLMFFNVGNPALACFLCVIVGPTMWADLQQGVITYRAPVGAKNDRPGDDGTLRSV